MSGRTSVFTFMASFVALITLLAGCSGRNAPTNPENEQWFCQSNESGEGWECVQDDNLALIPVPTRMPPEPVPEEDPAYLDLDDPLALEALNAPLERNPDAVTNAESVPQEAPQDTETPAADGADVPADAPAQRSVDQPPPPPAVPVSEAAVPQADPQIPRHVALAYTPDEPTLITDLPSDYFALQMLAVNTPAEIEAFIDDNSLVGMSGARVEKDGDIFYVLLVGIYETYGRADEAAKSLPPPLNEAEVWIRPLGSLQQAMLRADDLEGSSRF